jgi:heme-degrading monooxygenase HmoA
MLARIATFQLKGGAVDDLIRIFQDVLAPLAGGQPGFGGASLLIDRQAGKAMTIELWATEADLLAVERSAAAHEQLGRVVPLLAEPPAREVYEVGVQVDLTAQGRAHIRGI